MKALIIPLRFLKLSAFEIKDNCTKIHLKNISGILLYNNLLLIREIITKIMKI
jgi:hypothetical protein